VLASPGEVIIDCLGNYDLFIELDLAFGISFRNGALLGCQKVSPLIVSCIVLLIVTTYSQRGLRQDHKAERFRIRVDKEIDW